jgi:peptide deformylase
MKVIQSIPVDTLKGVTPVAKKISQLKTYLRNNPKQLYATPQLLDDEEPQAIIILRMVSNGKEKLTTIINPLITATQGTIAVEEEQVGIEGRYLNIRHPRVRIAYTSLPDLKAKEVELQGKSALIFQQALRLTQGITIDMFGMQLEPGWESLSQEEQQEQIQLYIKALKEIEQEMLQDKETEYYLKTTDYVAQNIKRSVDAELEDISNSRKDNCEEE